MDKDNSSTASDIIATPEILSFDYRFIRKLGEGANGRTWLAKSRINGQLVAIKELKLSAAKDFKSIELFTREAETLKSIEVTGVPKVYNYILPQNINETGYIIQEFIDAPSIQTKLDEGIIYNEKDMLDIIEALTHILIGLQTQYQPPIIHRDIKPSNVLAKTDDDGLHVFLIDFGAVANPQTKGTGSTIAGTYGYMAPEQLQGEVRIQSDFYALGATALHMLTGISPYNMPSNVFTLDYKSILHQKAPSASHYIYELLDYLLYPEPSKRPESAVALLEAIKNVRKDKSPHFRAKQTVHHFTDRYHLERAKSQNKWDLFFNKLSSPNTESITFPDSSWKTVSGMIWGFVSLTDMASRNFDSYSLCEYTYDADGRSWTAAWKFDLPPNTKFPLQCDVTYRPENPMISRILRVKQ